MWNWVRGAVSCSILLAFACGKSERDGAVEGKAGSTSSGGSGTSSGGRASGSGSSNGGAVDAGGKQATQGGSGTAGGAGASLGGEPPTPSEAGAPAGGAPDCSGSYHACGCGCCGAEPSAASCVYPDLGQDLTAVAAEDAARMNDTAGCENVGCSLGTDYFCCAAPPPTNDGASYETSWFIGGIERIRLHKLATDCSTLSLRQAADPTDPRAFPVEVPAGWEIETVTTLPCTSSATGPNAIGAIGKLSLRVVGDACVVDAHLTAFFIDDERELNAVRFDADGVPLKVSIDRCK